MMEAKGRIGSVARGLFLAAIFLPAGCSTADKAVTRPLAEQRVLEAQTATREQLLVNLEQQMAILESLLANAKVVISKQDVLLPATLRDYPRMLQDKEFNKKFATLDANCRLLISRPLDGPRKIRLSGDVVGPSVHFVLLGLNDDFWVQLPNTEPAKQGERDIPQQLVYTGTDNRGLLRPEEYFWIRPQDVLDLLFYDEVFQVANQKMICYMETWPDFYILNFIRPDWAEHISSRVWIDRRHLRPVIHQIFNGAGDVVAEGRFGATRPVKVRGGAIEVLLPYEIDLMWPRDLTVMKLSLSNFQINERIDAKSFAPTFSDYRRIDVPEGRDPRDQAATAPAPAAATEPPKP